MSISNPKQQTIKNHMLNYVAIMHGSLVNIFVFTTSGQNLRVNFDHIQRRAKRC